MGGMDTKKCYPRRNNSMKPTRWYSNRQEKQVAKTVGGRTVPNSGAIKFGAGDVTTDLFLLECKTCMTDKASFSVKEEWLIKNQEEAFAVGKDYSALAFNFGPDKPNYYIIDEKMFKKLNKLLEAENEESTVS